MSLWACGLWGVVREFLTLALMFLIIHIQNLHFIPIGDSIVNNLGITRSDITIDRDGTLVV